jgi:hypothetical protein
MASCIGLEERLAIDTDYQLETPNSDDTEVARLKEAMNPGLSRWRFREILIKNTSVLAGTVFGGARIPSNQDRRVRAKAPEGS